MAAATTRDAMERDPAGDNVGTRLHAVAGSERGSTIRNDNAG